jgi:hypothetical protein
MKIENLKTVGSFLYREIITADIRKYKEFQELYAQIDGFLYELKVRVRDYLVN